MRTHDGAHFLYEQLVNATDAMPKALGQHFCTFLGGQMMHGDVDWTVHASGAFDGDLLEPCDRPARRANTLEQSDSAIDEMQQRLDGQRRAKQRSRRADPTPATEILQRVDIEVRGGARRSV